MKSSLAMGDTGRGAGSHGQARLVFAGLAAILGLRIVLMPWPAMWLWGLNTQRFLSVPVALLLWLAMLLPFLGRAGAPLAAALERLGNRLAESQRARLLAAALVAALVFVLEDRTLFLGDALIRRVASDSPEFLARFRQALPFELLLYERLPLALQGFLLPPGMWPRLIGSAAAFALTLAGLELGRELARRGAALVAIACLIAFGGELVVFTGLGKPAALLCALTAMAALQSVRVATTGRGAAPLGCTVFAALLLHRAGLLLLPCWLLALVLWRGRGRDAERPATLTTWALALSPLLALAVVGPRVLRIVWGIDLPLHVTGAAGAGPLASHPVPWRALDVLNLTLLMAPAALPLLPSAMRRPWHWLGTREAAVLSALSVPWLIVAAVATPGQGIFRDLDFFATGAVALGAGCAWILSRILAGDAPHPRLAAAVAMACVCATLQLLCCFHDPASGLERVRAYLSEAPERAVREREMAWDFLALRAFSLHDWPLAAAACEQATRLAPSPRLLIMLGIARTYIHDYAGAKQAYTRVLERSPRELVAWAGLAGLATRLGDPGLRDSALVRVRGYPATSVKVRELERVIAQYPEFWPEVSR